MNVLISIVGERSEHWLGLFRALAARADVELSVLAADITASTADELRELERSSPHVRFLHAGHVLGERLTGHMASIVYDRRAGRLWPAELDVVHVIGEASYPTTVQVLRLAHRLSPSAAVTVYGAQNVLQRFPWPFRSFERRALRRVTAFTPVSADAECVLRAKGYRGPARVIPLGVDTAHFTPPTSPPAGPFTVGFVGRLEPHKGVELLLELLARIDCRLLLVGDGSSRAAIERSARARGLASRVELAGWVSHAELPRQLHRMHVLVLPSVEVVQRHVVPWIGVTWREQFGRVLCEAMACGVPVVGSELGEIPRVIGPAGATFAPGDLDGLVRALAPIRSDPAVAARLGREGAQRARDLYSWDSIAESYVDAWSQARRSVASAVGGGRMRKASLRSLGAPIGTYLPRDLPHVALRVLRHEGLRGFSRKLGRLIVQASRARPKTAGNPLPAQDPIPPVGPVGSDLSPVVRVHGRLRVVYVTEATGISGGHRQIFEQLNRLAARGHATELYTLGPEPDWFDLHVPVHTFETYGELVDDLVEQDAIKVATWWATAEHVLRAARTKGTPVYLVQDLETSYYRHDRSRREAVLASYSPEFSYVTESSWIRARLAELGVGAALISPGIDLDTYRPLDLQRRRDVVLTVGRSHYLKNLTLSWLAWRRLPTPRPELWMFGVEPDLGKKYGARYFTNPSDEEVAGLLNMAAVFLQTSRHEGFCLPVLEAMAAATPVVCTDAHGNRDFCRDGVNCLMPEARSDAVADSLETVLGNNTVSDDLSREGLLTAQRFDWDGQITQLETFLAQVQSCAGSPTRGPDA